MLQIEVARTNAIPGNNLRSPIPASLSIYVSGSQDDFSQLRTVLGRTAASGQHALMQAEMQGQPCDVFVFRTSTLLAAVVTDSGLIVCGDAGSLLDVGCAVQMCCGNDVAAGFYRHLEFGDPSGFGN